MLGLKLIFMTEISLILISINVIVKYLAISGSLYNLICLMNTKFKK